MTSFDWPRGLPPHRDFLVRRRVLSVLVFVRYPTRVTHRPRHAGEEPSSSRLAQKFFSHHFPTKICYSLVGFIFFSTPVSRKSTQHSSNEKKLLVSQVLFLAGQKIEKWIQICTTMIWSIFHPRRIDFCVRTL